MSMPLDSEILEFEKVLGFLKAHEGKSRNLEGFRKEAIERFAEIGWVVEVRCYSTNTESVAFDIDIVDRCERPRHGTDYERMQWEIRGDILEIEPEKKGVILPFSEAGMHDPSLATHHTD